MAPTVIHGAALGSVLMVSRLLGTTKRLNQCASKGYLQFLARENTSSSAAATASPALASEPTRSPSASTGTVNRRRRQLGHTAQYFGRHLRHDHPPPRPGKQRGQDDDHVGDRLPVSPRVAVNVELAHSVEYSSATEPCAEWKAFHASATASPNCCRADCSACCRTT